MSEYYKYFISKTLQWILLGGLLIVTSQYIIAIRETNPAKDYGLSSLSIFSILKIQSRETEKNSQRSQFNYQIPLFKEFNETVQQEPFKELADQYLKYYQRMTTFFPEISAGFTLLGYCYSKEGRLEEAKQAFKEAIALNKENFWNYYNLAIILRQQGFEDQSVLYLEQAVHTEFEKTLISIITSKPYKQLMHTDFHYDIPQSLSRGYGKAYYLLGLHDQKIGHQESAKKNFSLAQEGLEENDFNKLSFYVQAF